MIEDDLRRVSERLDVPVRKDLVDVVLARINEPAAPPARSRRRLLLAAAMGTLLATLALTPQVWAFAAGLLDDVGIHLGQGKPSAPTTPRSPLPDSVASDLEHARRQAAFPVLVPAALGRPDRVTLADGARVVTMTWEDGGRVVVLDQFDGTLGPFFEKQVGGVAIRIENVGGRPAWWIDGPHDLTYLRRDGTPASATARLAGPTLVWQSVDRVTYRLEGNSLTEAEALRVARSMASGSAGG